MLFAGDLRSGDRVPQDEIADQLGCSRLPVREAVIALVHEGLVTIERHRGAFVNPLTRETFHDQYELFGTALGIALRAASERGGAEFLTRLRVTHSALVAAGSIDDFALANDDLQSLVVSAAQSPRMSAVLRVLTGIVPGNFFEIVPGSRAIQHDGTTAMVEATLAGDHERATRECVGMMRRLAAELIALLDARGFFDA